MTFRSVLIAVICLFSLSKICRGQQTDSVKHTFFLIGDAGEITDGQSETLELLKNQINLVGKNSTVLFLGDNIYPRGLPDQDNPERSKMEKKLTAQLEPLIDFKGNYYFLHGNHDWDKGKKNGWQKALNQESFLKEYLNKDSVLLPLGGCPGPVEIKVSKDITMIILNSQWLLHPWDKPREEDGCVPNTKLGVAEALDEILRRNRHKQVLIAQHHPLYTYGPHGGAYTVKDHLFPLTNLNENLYLPLPIIGSIYPMYRSLLGSKQDVPNFDYKILRNGIHKIISKYDNIIHASGHEHSLQYLEKDNVRYIVSGSGAKSTVVRNGKLSKFQTEKKGFVVVKYLYNNTVEILYYTSDGGELAFNTDFEIIKTQKQEIVGPKPIKDTVITAFVTNQYRRKNGALLGDNYRQIWETPIEVPVFNISKEHGGLTILKRGGGMQTKSLRMEASNGKQYVLRSIEKFPEKAIPKALRKTFAGSIVEDQISASHPYGAFVVPFLADAAGVYHTNPKVVYIPDDPKFKEYRADFANTMALYEERPQGKAKDQDYFGNADKIVNTFKVLDKLKEDNDNSVDQKFVLRSRLFDMMIGDWDRHDDQWRWAKFKGKISEIYRPIPRDRDQAFFVNQGIIPKIISRKWALPKIEGFDDKINWAPGLMFNARYFDRSFLNGLSKEDWSEVALELKTNLTDEAIEEAIRKWPEKIYAQTGETVIKALKSRRNDILKYALEHYNYLAKEVDVLGSDKKEHFKVTRNEDGSVKVLVRKINKKDKLTKTLYNRTFSKKETKEIRLHGLDGKDIFEVDGKTKKSILVRIISGRGKDKITDESSVGGLSKKTQVYDRIKNTEVEKGTEAKANLSDNASVHDYDRKSFKYNTLMPLIDLKYNKDDGIFLGGGFLLTKHGWRKSPFKSKHRLKGDIAFATNSFNINYQGTYTDVVGKWDLELLADIQEPRFVSNYFGLGNETVFDTDVNDIDFHRVRFENNTYAIGLSNDIGAKGSFSLALTHRGIEIDKKSDVDFVAQELSSSIFQDEFYYTGLTSSLTFDTRDHIRHTKNGILWQTNLKGLKGWNSNSSNLYQVSSSFSSFIRLRIPSIFILANRVGFSHNLSKVRVGEFFNSSRLGGIENIRSFRRSRFHGQTSFYHNLDLRTKLFSFRTYLFPGELGILGFHDIGRVWLENENSEKWHSSKGVGIWIAPAKEFVISFNYGFAKEENLPFLKFGFFF